MKRIISAWIEQFIEFDSEMEYAVFEQDLKNSNKKYRINCQMVNTEFTLRDSITRTFSRKKVLHYDICRKTQTGYERFKLEPTSSVWTHREK